MSHFHDFFPAICAGFGLFLAGAMNLLLVRRGLIVRSIATVLALGIAVAVASMIDYPNAALGTSRLLALGMIPFLLLGSRKIGTRAAALAAAAHRPVTRFALLTIAGLGAAIGSIIAFEQADEAATEANLAELAYLDSRAPSVPSARVQAATDRGTPIVLKEPLASRDDSQLTEAEARMLHSTQLNDYVIRRSSADDRSNCHGWVFTGGRYLVGGDSVETILRENGYQEQPEPQPGDVILYRSGQLVTHTGLVRYVSEGQPVLIESKWGELGVFLHEPDKSPYGIEFAFYRSPRRGHLLAGVNGAPLRSNLDGNSPPSTAGVEE